MPGDLAYADNRYLAFAATLFHFRSWLAWDGPLVPPDSWRNRRLPLCRSRIGFNAITVADTGRRSCRAFAVCRAVDTDCGRRALGCCAVVRLLGKRRLLGRNPIGYNGCCTGYARARGLVDRCSTVRKKAPDSRAISALAHIPRTSSPVSTIESMRRPDSGVVVCRYQAQNRD